MCSLERSREVPFSLKKFSTALEQTTKMKAILSTKKLKPNQRDLLLGSRFKLVDYDAIEIQFLAFNAPSVIENAIFTSKNAVNAIYNSKITVHNCFCVGEKTKVLLKENRLNVKEMAQNAADLGQIITKKYKNEQFYFFCGNMRREELPEILEKKNVTFSEIKTYTTVLKPKKFNQHWDGILFFSPSGVSSYISENKNTQDTIAFCIGKTTATNAKKYFEYLEIANQTSVESVIAKAVKKLRAVSH